FSRQAGSRLTPATPSSAANRRCSASWSRSIVSVRLEADATLGGQDLLDAVENGSGDVRFALKRNMVRPFGSDDGHFVGVDVEAGIIARDVVGDNQIDMLLLPLCRRTPNQVLGLRGKAHE